MYKVVGITTHGFATFEGTPIMCYRWAGVFMEAKASYVFIYDDKGKMVEARQPQYHKGALVYRGVKIVPKTGKRSPIAKVIRDGLRTKSEQSHEDMEFVHPPI